MGLFNISVFFGLSIGPLAGGVISDTFNLDAAFGCMGIFAFAAFVLSFLLLPPARLERGVIQAKPPADWGLLLKDTKILGLLIFRFAYTGCIGIIWSFLPVFAGTRFSFSSSTIGILIMLSVFISGLMQTPMGYIADRFNRRIMVISGGLVTGYGILRLGWAEGFWDMFIADVLFGLGGGISMPAIMAIAVTEGSKNDAMGSVMGLMTLGHSLGMLIGALSAGLIMDFFDLRQAFFLGSGMMVVGVVLFAFQFRHSMVEQKRLITYGFSKKE
jgi:MFS family permease